MWRDNYIYTRVNINSGLNLGINSEAVESLSIKILNKKCRNIIRNTIYRPPNRDIETCENYFKNLFDTVSKHTLLVDDFNLNVLDFENNKKVQNFMNLMFRYGMIPTINKPTRVTANTATAIDRNKTNVIIDTDFKGALYGLRQVLVSESP